MLRKWTLLLIALSLFFAVPSSYAGGLSELEKLGKLIYNNKKLSFNRNQSCKTCHHKKAGFADPVNAQHPVSRPVSEGSISGDFGNRNAPSAAYAGFSPRFHWDGELFIGGVFWDGRASGMTVTATSPNDPTDPLFGTKPTFDPMADQAKGPFLNPIEMSLGTIEDVVDRVLDATPTCSLLKRLFPAAFESSGKPNYPEAYNAVAIAISAFERSGQVNRFNSRFDKFWREYGGDVSTFGVTIETIDGAPFRRFSGIPDGFRSRFLSRKELIGLALFNSDSAEQLGVSDKVPEGTRNGGMCYLCHSTQNLNITPDDPNYDGLVSPGSYPPLFTDFSYDNLGMPKNSRAIKLFEHSGNVYTRDLGLGGQASIIAAACTDCDPVMEEGKFKVPSLRGVSRSAPYGHNGFFATLLDVVHFYNTRDVETENWPEPEVSSTVNRDELGNLGLTSRDERRIVQFMKTLKD